MVPAVPAPRITSFFIGFWFSPGVGALRFVNLIGIPDSDLCSPPVVEDQALVAIAVLGTHETFLGLKFMVLKTHTCLIYIYIAI
jgi:hypothetical protein